MAKQKLETLSKFEKDLLTGEVKTLMETYQLKKQTVYDRRFALGKKIKAAGMTQPEALKLPVVDGEMPKPNAENPKRVINQAAPKKAAAKKAPEPEKGVPVEAQELDTFEIELAPPPMLRGASLERQLFTEKLIRTVESTPVNKAFLIPKDKKTAASSFLKNHDIYGRDFIFRVFNVLNNDKLVRFYKTEAPKTPKTTND